ncbi:MAG: YkvA family protein [Actinomycetota bacterium]
MPRALVFALIAAAAIWAVLVLALLLAGRRTAARELAALIPNLARLFRGLLGDPRVPRGSKVLLLAGMAWIVSPIDLIPEFLPVIGPLDDAVVAALVLRHLVKRAGPDVLHEHWHGDGATLDRILRLFGAAA